MKFLKQLKLWTVLVAVILFCGTACTSAAPQEETAIEKDPCDTIIITRDTTIQVTDTIYVDPADTTGTDSVFTND